MVRQGFDRFAAMDSGDLDGDGRRDLVVLDGLGEANLLLGNGDGTFRLETSPETAPDPGHQNCEGYSVKLRDLDGEAATRSSPVSPASRAVKPTWSGWSRSAVRTAVRCAPGNPSPQRPGRRRRRAKTIGARGLTASECGNIVNQHNPEARQHWLDSIGRIALGGERFQD